MKYLPILAPLFLALVAVAGWVTNIMWTFNQDGFKIFLGILGIIVAPIGSIHGIYLWF
jgi:hypothetical protein